MDQELVKMGFCYLPPEKSKWDKGQYELLLFIPWQSQTNSEQ